jgi:glutaredoxin
MQSVTLILYSTEFCHLCEAAEDILRQAGIIATVIDIMSEDKLIELYGTRIPVLKRNDNNAELGWPFDEAAVIEFDRRRTATPTTTTRPND